MNYVITVTGLVEFSQYDLTTDKIEYIQYIIA